MFFQQIKLNVLILFLIVQLILVLILQHVQYALMDMLKYQVDVLKELLLNVNLIQLMLLHAQHVMISLNQQEQELVR